MMKDEWRPKDYRLKRQDRRHRIKDLMPNASALVKTSAFAEAFAFFKTMTDKSAGQAMVGGFGYLRGKNRSYEADIVHVFTCTNYYAGS